MDQSVLNKQENEKREKTKNTVLNSFAFSMLEILKINSVYVRCTGFKVTI